MDASTNLKFAKHGDFRYFNYVISKFTREIPNELNEYNVFGENNLRHFEEQISQP